MQIGLKLPQFGPGTDPDLMLRWAQFAEAVGFHFILTGDHIALTPDVLRDYPAPYYEPFTTMAWLAGKTQRIKLGFTVIVVPYRHPALLAHLTSTLDQLSDGRLIVGVGVGWAESEFQVLGMPFHERGKMTDEYLAALKLLWTNDTASFDGRYVKFSDVSVSPRPLQSPHPPIWVGGASRPAMRRAVRYGDAWHPLGVTTAWLRDHGMPALRNIAEAEGKPMPILAPRIFCRLTDDPIPEDERIAGEGTLDQVRRDFGELQELGAEYVHLDTKRNSPTAHSDRHQDEAWRDLTILADQVFDLRQGTLR
ncbi:MAG: TIGR03619 family F420-dependent LLM class oxidoreductase [Chloroflexi bacterium]|nr:TIGR03619 family F420-dependent LLM class oxidoreductase [Chloroflexota bacterium]